MKRDRYMMVSMAVVMGSASSLWAGQATTSATAGSRGWGTGWAAATADYRGSGPGYANTQTRSGQLNLAQGVALGLDRDGLSFSTSYALAPRLGPAVAGTFNLNIGLDGAVATSVGRTVASGDPNRVVSAGGGAGARYGSAPAWATVSGSTGPRGEVRSFTNSQSRPAPLGAAPRGYGRTWRDLR